MAAEIKPGTLTELLIRQAVPMMEDKWIASVEIVMNDEMVTLIYHMKDGKILRDSWKRDELK